MPGEPVTDLIVDADTGDIRPATDQEIAALPDGTPRIDLYLLADYPAEES